MNIKKTSLLHLKTENHEIINKNKMLLNTPSTDIIPNA